MVDESAASTPCCREVDVNDDPDYVLHWYDHFYVTRPCFGALSANTNANGSIVKVNA
jgi:hypothetical protein